MRANIPQNSGDVSASIISPKGSFVFGPFNKTEYYVNYGESFHSNDGRGVTLHVDPNSVLAGDPQAAEPVTPLVRAKGVEIGLRSDAVPHLRTTLGLFDLRLGSELVFSGDAGSTAPGRPSQRTGVELANFFAPNKWLTIDADASYTTAHFTDICVPAVQATGNCGFGNEIPGALQTVYAAGVTVDAPHASVFGSLRYRYFGPRPLVEDNSVRSQGSGLFNAQLGLRATNNVTLSADVFNVFNQQASDIDYYYTSRLPFEAAGGVNDVHFHPTVPRTIRLSYSVHT